MRIGIDARMMGPESRGIGRYVERLLNHLAELDNENEYVVFARGEAAALVPEKMKTIVTGIRWYTLAEQTRLGKLFDAEKADLVFVPHWNAPLRMKTPLALTIHDMILWEHPSLASTTLSPLAYFAKYFFYRLLVAKNAERAKIVFTVSESAKNSVLRNLKVAPEKIIVTPLGVDEFPDNPRPTLSHTWERINEVCPPPSSEEGARRAGEGCPSRRPFILSVGSGYPHKNMETFFKVAKELMASDPQLRTVVVGTDPAFAGKLKKQAGEIVGKDSDRVRFAGMVSDAELGELYKHANALIFTSEAEGFGLPPLEAALAGTPVVASNIDTSRETLGDSVPLVEPADAAGYVAAYRKIMADSAYKTSILSAAKDRALTFTWERTARQTAEGFKRIFSTR